MGTGGALEHVMETLDNESFYGKATAGKCVQAFGPLPRAEHHVRLDRTSPCQDSSGKSPAPRLTSSPQPHPNPYSLAAWLGLQTEPQSQPSFPEVRYGAGRSKEMWQEESRLLGTGRRALWDSRNRPGSRAKSCRILFHFRIEFTTGQEGSDQDPSVG